MYMYICTNLFYSFNFICKYLLILYAPIGIAEASVAVNVNALK